MNLPLETKPRFSRIKRNKVPFIIACLLGTYILVFDLGSIIFRTDIENIILNDIEIESESSKRSSSIDNSLTVGDKEKSATYSRLERMDMYRERYDYKPPIVSYDNHAERDEICGPGPSFETFFARSRNERSSYGEDERMYHLFFNGTSDGNIEDASIATVPRGTIVEMGAFDGMRSSNSRFYDTCLGWDTLLIEADPRSWKKLIHNRPHAHRFNFAPSCSEYDEMMNKTVKFNSYASPGAGLADASVDSPSAVDVPCGSLTKVLLDIFPGGHVSFFSLDVEGAEPLVLENIDFDKVFIEVLIAENWNAKCNIKCESREKFRKIMKDNGYLFFPGHVRKSDLFIHPLSKHRETSERWR